jgi:hypothetical protein
MLRDRSLISGRSLKILVVCLALLMLAVMVPAVVTADESSSGGAAKSGVVHKGDWTKIEPWASLLNKYRSSGMQLATLDWDQFYDDMETDTGQWTTTGDWEITDEWQPWGEYNQSWSDSPDRADYSNNTDSTLTGPVLDLSEVGSDQRVSLQFNIKMDLENWFDRLYVEFSGDGGLTWYMMEYLTGTTGTEEEGYNWLQIPSEMMTDQFQFRFRLVTNATNVRDGVHIDDVAVWADSTDNAEYSDPRIAYVGSWRTATQAWPAGWEVETASWSYKTSSTPGDLIKIEFTGPAIEWYGKVGPNCGIAYVSLDGEVPWENDLYWDPAWEPGWPAAMLPWGGGGSYHGLKDGPHTLIIACSGTKNPDSTGYAVSLESVYVWGTVDPASGVTRYEQTDLTNLKYAGTWAATGTASASGGNLASVDYPGSAVNVSFEGTDSGTYLAWYAKKGPGCGKAQLVLDEDFANPVTVDLYASSYDRYKQKVYNTGLLRGGSHTLSIYWKGQKNTYATSNRINVDAFDVLGTLNPASTPTPILWRYQQSDSRLTLLGNWGTVSTGSASGGSYLSTSQKNAAILVSFTSAGGPAFQLFGTTGPGMGNMEVIVDESYSIYPDLYSRTTAYKQLLATSNPLSPGPHTIRIKCLGTPSPGHTGTAITLDAIDMTGYLTQAPMPTRHEQDDTNINYAFNDWTTSYSGSASSGSYLSAAAPGSSVNVTFNGNYCAWIAKKGPGCGKALVVLDDGTPGEWSTTVDLYAASYDRYKQKVYNTGYLTNGPHTLSIYWIGQKNTYATSTRINVDAFDVYPDSLPDALDPAYPIPWRYDQTDSRFTWLGWWGTMADPYSSGGSFASTSLKDAAVVLRFYGTGFTLLGKVGPAYGLAQVQIDGSGVWTDIDFYRAATGSKVGVYTSTLTLGDHAVIIKCKGEASPGHTGKAVSLDALDMTGYMRKLTTPPERVEQDNATYCTYGEDPVWTPATDASASGASLTSVNADGGKMKVTFTGTNLTWLAKANRYMGKATVILEPETLNQVTTVDLYSYSTTYKKVVYKTALLENTNHILYIEWTGTKNAASLGTSINVDAFDLLGAIWP